MAIHMKKQQFTAINVEVYGTCKEVPVRGLHILAVGVSPRTYNE